MNNPKTVLLHHHLGIGDLIWHLPYIRAVAEKSKDGKISVIARPSTLADQILSAEECVENTIIYDRKPRPSEKRRGQHQGYGGMMRFAQEIKAYKFDRILITSNRSNYLFLALAAGIPQRAAYGFQWYKRLLLSHPPYINRYTGEGNRVYPEVTDFMVKQGYVDGPIVPKMRVPETYIAAGEEKLGNLSSPRIAFAIGASEPHKNLGVDRFSQLATALREKGFSIVLVGGPAETEFAAKIYEKVPENLRSGILKLCQKDILLTAGVLKNCQFCTGNDTGVLNVAVACDVPSIGYFGGRSRLRHDPLIQGMSAPSMEDISVEMILAEMESHQWF